jgi:hypothetical protein
MSDAARRILLVILLLGTAGVSLELWLMAHTEDVYQQIPLWLAAAGVVSALILVARPSVGAVRLFQAVMALFLLSGVVGMALHFQVNIEFQQEMDAALSGLALYQKAILAKSPPALAPGAMIQLGLIGLAYTFRHPALVAGRENTGREEL